MDSMDNGDEETGLRRQYGHNDRRDSGCSTMPTPCGTSAHIPAHYCGDNITTQTIKSEDGHSKTMQEDITSIQQAHYCGDNVTTQTIKCEDGHSGSMQEDITRTQQSQIVDVHVNTGTQNFTVDEQQQDLNDLEYKKSLTNTNNVPTWTCNASEFVEAKQDPDADPGEFDGVSGKTRQWIVDEHGLLKEVKTEPTNWVDGTDNCTAVTESNSDLKVHQRRHTGQRLVELCSLDIFEVHIILPA